MKLEHIAINVPHPIEMAEWYVRHCEMQIVLKVEGPPYTHFIADKDRNTAIEIYYNPAAPVPDYFEQSHLVYHHAFSSDQLEEDKERLLTAGASFVEELRPGNGSRLVMLRDPWGIALQLVQRAGGWMEK